MKPRVSPELERVVGAVEIVSPTAFRLGERMFEAGGPRPLFAPSRHEPGVDWSPAMALRRALTDELYSRFYARTPANAFPATDLEAHRGHLVALSRANTSAGCWEPGWRVRAATDDGGWLVEGHGLEFVVASEKVRPEGERLAAGEACRVRVPGEMRNLRPGFYSAVGDAQPAAAAELPWRVRTYWHLRPGGAPAWLHLVTRELNQLDIPFQLKVVADPCFYLRADAGVLSFEPEHFAAARPVVQGIHRAIQPHLRDSVPGLTCELAPGLGVAEGAADGSSFGVHRCDLIAVALVGLGYGRVDLPLRLDTLERTFRAAGLDPTRPHLAPGSTTRYRRLAAADRPAAPRGVSSPASAAGLAPGVDPDPLAAAARIGDALCRCAYRSADRSNWLGRAFAGEVPVPGVSALGPSLYGGTAGVALFLAELHTVTGDRNHRATALGAVRQALLAVEREPERSRPVSLFEGQLGIGWAAARIAARIGEAELGMAAGSLVSSIARELPGDFRWSLIEGHAGAILVLLRLHEGTGDGLFLDAAMTLGRALLEARTAGDWVAVSAGSQPPAGLAHGVTGVGLALLELAIATGNAELRAAADACLDTDADRHAARGGGGPLDAPGASKTTGWCEGTAGIALARLRAMEVDRLRVARHEPAARAGVAATLEAIERCLGGAPMEYGLCHGLAGLADVAATGARVLGEPLSAAWASRVGERLANAAAYDLGGEAAVSDPSLFTGIAGIGYSLLRLANPDRVATPLLPHADRMLAAVAGRQRVEATPRAEASEGAGWRGEGP